MNFAKLPERGGGNTPQRPYRLSHFGMKITRRDNPRYKNSRSNLIQKGRIKMPLLCRTRIPA